MFLIITSNTHIWSFVKGYHVYKYYWALVIGEHLITKMETSNPVDKYTMSVNKDDLIVGHLPLGKNGKISKTIFYFFQADRYTAREVVITGKAINLGDGDVKQVPCTLKNNGKKVLV